MKYCPNCHKQYDETWITFCSDDGTILMDSFTVGQQPPAGSQRPPYAPPHEPQTWRSPDPNAPGGWVAPDERAPVRTPVWTPPPPPGVYQRQPSQGLAVASMLVGIIGLVVGTFCLGPIPGIAALILGIVALNQIKKAPDLNGGKVFAIIGIVAGSLSVLIYGALIIFAIVANILS